MTAPRIEPLGDAALLVTFADVPAEDSNRAAHVVAHALRAHDIEGVRDIVPAMACVAIHVDPAVRDPRSLVSAVRHLAAQALAAGTADSGRSIDIPVCYDPTTGPDLESVAAWAGTTVNDVIARHAGASYRVYILGFLPGFAYMGPVDPSIAAPRHASPRARVTRGSVGIAGRQTGIYPRDTPGGWQIIGRTPVTLFDPARARPALLEPGDVVRFVPVSRHELDALALEAR